MRLCIFIAWSFLLVSCGSSGQGKTEAPITEYSGQPLHQSSDKTTVVSGTIKLKNHDGNPITIEARHSVACQYGHCPAIGDPAAGTERLTAPGPYTLTFQGTAEDIMIIVTYQPSSEGTRVAHQWLGSQEPNISGVDLSLDKPYPPLR